MNEKGEKKEEGRRRRRRSPSKVFQRGKLNVKRRLFLF